MCKACSETPDGQGRRCQRSDGFTSVEGDQRSRSRGLNNAAAALADGDYQAAANQMEHARRAQLSLDGGTPAPEGTPDPAPAPHRDFIVSPSDLDSAVMQLENINRARELDGLPPLEVKTTTQRRKSEQDPIMVWERCIARVTGGTEEELAQLGFRNVGSNAERRVDKYKALEATAAIMRIESDGRFVPRAEGGDRSTAALLNQYIHDQPGGPLRTRYAPVQADQRRSSMLAIWAQNKVPTNDFERSMVKAVKATGIHPRDAGTAAAAYASYDRHMEQRAKEKERQAAMSAASAQTAPPTGTQRPARADRGTPSVAVQRSRWLGQVGDRIAGRAVVEVADPLHYESHSGRGVGHLYVFVTDEGDVMKWISPHDECVYVGDRVTVSGWVKAHNEYKGERQTELRGGMVLPE